MDKIKTQVFVLLILLFACIPFYALPQATNPALVGYFHNWHTINAPYIQLDQVDQRYNIIDVAFAVPQFGTDYKMQFIPDQVSSATFISQIQSVQAQGRKVIISIGGATAPISLDNITERDTFVATMTNIINTYGFDGIDIDFEGSSLSVSGGTISAPTDQPIVNLIFAVKQIMANYHTTNNQRLFLSMAPETAFVQGGQSAYGGIWGAYLPIIDALRDSIEILHVQLYNSGSMFGIDGNIYTQGTADFIVAMTEAVIQGFNTAGGVFSGLPASKIAIGLPACAMAAGGGYTSPTVVKSAVDYLRGIGTQPGSYILLNPNGYPALRGMMTWSINWDSVATCGGAYEFADNFQDIFGITTSTSNSIEPAQTLSVYPNPTDGILNIRNSTAIENPVDIHLYDMTGRLVSSKTLSEQAESIDLSHHPTGMYCLKYGNSRTLVLKQ